MYIAKKHLSRRALLTGAGASIGLPLLDAMIPACTALAATAAAPRPRMGFFYLPHGAIMNNTPHGASADNWTPDGDGTNFSLKPILEPLERFREYLTIVSNLDNRPGSGTVHGINPATWLSAVRPESGVVPDMAPTIDQIAARHIGQDTMLPSIEVASEPPIVAGNCGGSFGCSYMTTLSFQSARLPLPMEYNPRKLFIQLFGEGDTEAQRDILLQQNASVLDIVSARAQAMKKGLGPADRETLDDYLDTVREIERRVNVMGARDLSQLDLPQVPMGVVESFDRQLDLMFDLIALAYQADITRIATYLMAAEATNRTYNHIGIADAFHPLSHHGNDLAKMERLVRIQRYHVAAFAKFVDRLASMPAGDGSMLDQSILLYGSNMSNSDLHDNYPLPNVVVGGGCGALKGGQHLKCPERTPISNLHLTLLQRAGVPAERVGDSTGELTEL